MPYAVFKYSKQGRYEFSVFHDTLELAREEAERLANMEKCRFGVLKLVGTVMQKPMPFEWTEVS